MREGEEALRRVREQFERSEDPAVRVELAAGALDEVDRQLDLIRERRQLLDSAEGSLWAKRNRLEQLLIQANGRDWWQQRRKLTRAQALAAGSG